MKVWIGVVAAGALALAGGAQTAVNANRTSAGSGMPGRNGARGGHHRPLPPYVQKKEQGRRAAAERVAKGLATPNAAGLVQLENGTFVRYELQGSEHLTTVLIDFSDVTHGNLPAPDRTVDNSTYWSADVSPNHYRDMLFAAGGGSYGLPSMSDYYLEQSSGRFTWTGQVSDWVQIGATAAELGRNSGRSGDGGDDFYGPVYRVVDYALKALAASGNYGGIDVSQVDRIDRYDCDADGNYNEPDGYIDHFAIVHAGVAEEADDSHPDAIWSHRWYANFDDETGPASCHLGGYQLPGTDLWVGDYTIEPENGGVGVFAHEFGHDLGLPDLYDYAGSPENGTGFWTLMSSGSWASDSIDALDDKPVHMGAWEKLTLGWLEGDLARVTLGDDAVVELGPAEGATDGRAQALRVDLPNIESTVTLFAPEGTDPNYFYSGQGDDIDTSMARSYAAAGPTAISFRANWDIEKDWDYAYLEAQVAGAWSPVQTSASSRRDPNGQNFGFGITGTSRGWKTVTATLPAGTSAVRFRYWTDGAVTNPGIAVDSVTLGGTVDDATSLGAWTLAGFRQITNGQYLDSFFHYYLLESRSYILNDTSLCGAYNFLTDTLLEKQCYASGVLIWYRNSQVPDNNVSQHPGTGQVLPVDSHPTPMITPDGRSYWRARWQTWDATFGLDPHSVRLSQPTRRGIVSQTYQAAPVASFVDASPTAYYNASVPTNSVKTAGSGLRVDILASSPDGSSYQLHVH